VPHPIHHTHRNRELLRKSVVPKVRQRCIWRDPKYQPRRSVQIDRPAHRRRHCELIREQPQRRRIHPAQRALEIPVRPPTNACSIIAACSFLARRYSGPAKNICSLTNGPVIGPAFGPLPVQLRSSAKRLSSRNSRARSRPRPTVFRTPAPPAHRTRPGLPLQQLRSRIEVRIREPAINLPWVVVSNPRQRRRRRQLRIRRRAHHLPSAAIPVRHIPAAIAATPTRTTTSSSTNNSSGKSWQALHSVSCIANFKDTWATRILSLGAPYLPGVGRCGMPQQMGISNRPAPVL